MNAGPRLADVTSPKEGEASAGLGPPPCDDALESYIEKRGDGPQYVGKADGEPWIIAFSDPNDPLSYPIPPDLCQAHPDVFLDVITSVARTAFWLPGFGRITDPITEHTGYGRDDRIIELILEGYQL